MGSDQKKKTAKQLREIKTIFISATSIDLSDYVKEVKTVLEKAGYRVKTMVDFGAQPDDAVTVSLAELEDTDGVLGIYARRYGYIPEGDDMPVTEQEFHHALSLGKPVFAFIVDDANTDLKPGTGEDDGSEEAQAKQSKINGFIDQINTALVRERFVAAEDLKANVLALGKVMDIVETIPNFTEPERRPIVHILDQGTLEAICDAFSRNRYHVLHVSTHGEPGHIILEDENGRSGKVSADDFVRKFPMDRQPVLTLFSACHTGATGEIASSFADVLVGRGFPYVIAMQEAVSDRYATEFAETLYQKLAYDETPVIENAFSQTRIDLEAKRIRENENRSREQQVPPEWMVPALYKGNLYRYAAYETGPIYFSRDMEIHEEAFDPDISHRKIGEFVGRRRQLLTLRREVINTPKGGSALITGMGGVGKSTLVARPELSSPAACPMMCWMLLISRRPSPIWSDGQPKENQIRSNHGPACICGNAF